MRRHRPSGPETRRGRPSTKAAPRFSSPLSEGSSTSTAAGPTQRRVFIRPAMVGQVFDVSVDPPVAWSNFNQERPDIRSARRYAQSLKVVHGWGISDETGEPA